MTSFARVLSGCVCAWVALGCGGSKETQQDAGPSDSVVIDTPVPIDALEQHTLTVVRAGTGTGTVTSSPSGIDCGADCSEPFAAGTMVTLTAMADASSTFVGWSGDCTGTATCTITIAAAASVTATFDRQPSPGVLSLVEVAVLNPGTSGTFFGQGIETSFAFLDPATAVAPVLEEQPGSLLGCKAWSYTPAQALAAIGVDEGAVQANLPNWPSCVFQAGVGYTCPEPTTASTGGVIAAGPAAGTATLTDNDTTFTAATSNNRYVRITGAANAANNGSFPIVAFANPNTIAYGNPAMVAETLPATATHVNVAGMGAIPAVPDPGFLADTASLDFVHTAGGGNSVATFTATTGAGSVGDDFTLTTQMLTALNTIPQTGTSFSIGCDNNGCVAGTATGSVLELVTTDTPTTGLSPFALPAPTTKQVRIRCIAVGTAMITVPAAFSTLIMDAAATRIQATFARITLMTGGPATTLSLSGHAVRGYTN